MFFSMNQANTFLRFLREHLIFITFQFVKIIIMFNIHTKSLNKIFIFKRKR